MPSRRPKDPLTRDEFDLHYWGADYASVPASTRREFYSDYRESGLSFARYKRETTQRVENPARRPASRRKNPAAKYICTNDRYCPTPDTFSSLSDFQAMCEAVFGVRVPLASIGGDTYVDEHGEVVLRPAARRRR